MGICPRCQSSVSNEADFCGFCGSRMTVRAEATRHRDYAEVAPEEEREAAGTAEEETLTADEIVARYRVYVAKQLAEGGSRSTIVAGLVQDGWPEDVADQFVDKTQLAVNAYMQSPEVKAERRGKYAKHILFGALWGIGGAVVTLATYSAAEPGGTYVITWGAMGFGALEFLYGLSGWLTNQ